MVVCVDDSPMKYKGTVIGRALRIGEYFTVRENAMGRERGAKRDTPAVLLAENTWIDRYGQEGLWSSRRFRLAESSHSESAQASKATPQETKP